MFKDSIPRFFIVAFLSAVIFVGVCFTRDEARQHLQLQDNQERKLAAVGGFSDTLAPNTVCTDLMRLSVILQDGDGDSLGDALPFDYTLKTYFNHSPSGTQAMIVYSKEKKYAAAVFRGTELFSLDDWTTNLNIDLVRADIPSIPSDVELHEGFIDAVFATGLAELFEPELIGLINDSDLDLEHIYLTGHSLGGALAHILGSYLAGNNNDLNFRVITFGQPNVGNSDFKQWSEDLSNLSVFRFVNRNDVVPRILGFRYKPAGHLFHIERRKSKLYYNQDGEGRYAGVPVNWYFAPSLTNHLSRFYTRFFEEKSQITKFWPRTFEVTPACSWWQFWC